MLKGVQWGGIHAEHNWIELHASSPLSKAWCQLQKSTSAAYYMQLSETNETDKGRPYIYVMLAAFETSYVPHDPNCISPKKIYYVLWLWYDFNSFWSYTDSLIMRQRKICRHLSQISKGNNQPRQADIIVTVVMLLLCADPRHHVPLPNYSTRIKF